MKNLYRLLTAAALGALVLACQKPAPEVSFSDTTISVGPEAVTKTVSVTTNYAWTASTTASWLQVSPASGEKGTTKLTVKLEANPDPEARTGTVTVVCEGVSMEIPVTQAQKDMMTVEGDEATIPAEGGSFQITLKSNIEYTVVCNDSWVKQSTTKSYDSYTHTFVAEANPRYDPRQTTILFMAGATSKAYVIKQEAKTALILNEDEFSFSSEAATFKVELTTNLEYDVVMPEADWLTQVETKGLSDYTLQFAVAANESYDARSAEIVVKSKDGSLSQVIKVSQAQKDALILSGEREYDFDVTGGSFTVKLSSNVDYEIEMPDWIKETQTKGLTDYEHIFLVTENTNVGLRTGQVVFTDAKSGLSEAVTVSQAGLQALPQLRVTHSLATYTVPAFTGADLTGTIDWGDGKSEAFAAGKSHTYSSAGTYTVIIELQDARTFSLADVQSIEAIDLSRFKK